MDHSRRVDKHILKKFIYSFHPTQGEFFGVLLILVVGLLVLSWFRGDFLILGGDFGFPLDRLKYLGLTLFSWDETFSMGMPNPRQLASLIPYAIYGGFTSLFGLSLVFFEKSLFYIWFASSGLSMYFLCYVMGMRRLARLIASLFYMMNTFSLIIIWHIPHALLQMPYAYLPLLLGLYIKGLKEQRGIGYIMVMCLIWLFTTTAAYAWPTAAALHWMPILLYFLFHLVVHRKRFEIFQVVKFTTRLIFVWVLFNFYWIFPFVIDLPGQFEAAHLSSYISDIATFELNSAKLVGALRLLGYWSLQGEYKGDPFYVYGAAYLSFPFILISFLVPLLAFLPFLTRKTKKEPIFYFGCLALLSLFLIKGPYPPLGQIMFSTFERYPYIGRAFRAIYLQFGMHLSLAYAVLVGLSLVTAYDYMRVRVGKVSFAAMAIILVLLFGVLVYPFWTGDLVNPGGKIWPSNRVKIPQDYYEFKRWTATEGGNFRIFSLPMSKSYNAAYNWEYGYAGGDIMRWFSSKSVINVNTGRFYELIGEEIEDFSGNRNMAKLLGLMITKYILLHRDTNWEFIKGHGWWFKHNLDNLTAFLSSQDGIRWDRNFGKLDLYKISDEYLLPHIYSSSPSTLVAGDMETPVPMTKMKYLEAKPALLFTEQMQNAKFEGYK